MHIQDPEQRAWIQSGSSAATPRPPARSRCRSCAGSTRRRPSRRSCRPSTSARSGSRSRAPSPRSPCSTRFSKPPPRRGWTRSHRDAPPWAPQRAGQHRGQVLRADLPGVRGRHRRLRQGSGDVKYHLGSTGMYAAESGEEISVYLAANPSHLEAVNPVLEGIVRAKQDVLDRGDEFPVLPVLMHGDAAFAGQGVVAETLNLSQLRGYRTGGTVHIIVNNQVGFTTSPESSRVPVYATDVARMVQAPIFHVNGDDPEACVRVGAAGIRVPPGVQQGRGDRPGLLPAPRPQRGRRPLADQPADVQPHRPEAFGPQALHRVVDRAWRPVAGGRRAGPAGLPVAIGARVLRDARGDGAPRGDQGPHRRRSSRRTWRPRSARRPSNASSTPRWHSPTGSPCTPRLQPQLQRRAQMVEDGTIDWAMGETLAFGSLLIEGRNVRLTGQDTRAARSASGTR